MEHVRVVSVNKSEWLQVLKSIKVGVNGSFIFFFFEKSENIEFYFRSNVFFLFSYLFCDMCATVFNRIFIHSRKTMDFELFLR